MANRPGVQRITPWEKKQFPVKDVDGDIYLSDGYQATFTGFDKTTWIKQSQENLIILLPTRNAGKIWFSADPNITPPDQVQRP